MKKSYICKILSKTQLCTDTFDYVVEFPEQPEPGQFIHILCGDGVLLRRPISICDYSDKHMRFIFAVRGEGTKRLAKYEVGDKLDILGPLGNGFNVAKKGDKTPLVIGGGIGIFPLYSLSKHLGENTEAIIGFQRMDCVIMEQDFNSVCAKTYVTTDDGSYGFPGRVTDVFKQRLEKGEISSVYACGPIPMLKAVAEIAQQRGLFCELSLEQRMGCGIGACAVCVCKSTRDEYLKVCQYGPVFNAREVDFSE